MRVRIVPASQTFDTFVEERDGATVLTLNGDLTDSEEPAFRTQLDRLVAVQPKRVVLRLETLQAMSPMAARALGFLAGKLNLDEDIYVVGATAAVRKTLQDAGVWEEFTAVDSYDGVGAQADKN